MVRGGAFPIIVATDGSRQARAALAAALVFPWPVGARPRVVLARGGVVAAPWPAPLLAGFTRGLDQIARRARQALKRRWPDADVAVVDQPAVEAILAQARSLGAKAIVLGSRGHGILGRFVLGSVSRGVVRRARCAVLVVKGRPLEIRRLVMGLDGSAHARRAAGFVAGLTAPARGRVAIVRVVEPVRLPSISQLPASIRARLHAQEATLNRRRLAAARREVEAVGRRLRRAGWMVRPVVTQGVPLIELLRAVARTRANLVVVGAPAVSGLERQLLGSVADGALTRSSVSVLVVR